MLNSPTFTISPVQTYGHFCTEMFPLCGTQPRLENEEIVNFSAIVYLQLCGFCSEGFPLPLGAWDRMRCFIVALPGPSL